jgi:hypothetical protein
MWFFGAYQPALTTIDRSVTRRRGQPAPARRARTEADGPVHHRQLTSQLSDSTRLRVAYNNSGRRPKACCRR